MASPLSAVAASRDGNSSTNGQSNREATALRSWSSRCPAARTGSLPLVGRRRTAPPASALPEAARGHPARPADPRRLHRDVRPSRNRQGLPERRTPECSSAFVPIASAGNSAHPAHSERTEATLELRHQRTADPAGSAVPPATRHHLGDREHVVRLPGWPALVPDLDRLVQVVVVEVTQSPYRHRHHLCHLDRYPCPDPGRRHHQAQPTERSEEAV